MALFMGGETTPSRAIVQSAGHAYRLTGQRASSRNSAAMATCSHLLLRYTQSLITQMSQTAVCNRHHSARPATVPVAAAVARSPVGHATADDPGAHCQHARRAARGRHRGGRQTAEARRHQVRPRARSPCSIARTSSACPASVIGGQTGNRSTVAVPRRLISRRAARLVGRRRATTQRAPANLGSAVKATWCSAQSRAAQSGTLDVTPPSSCRSSTCQRRTRSLPENLLLAALPAADRRRLLANHDPIDLVVGRFADRARGRLAARILSDR